MLTIALLWYDDDSRRPLPQKIRDASARYRERLGADPTVCHLSPAQAEQALHAGPRKQVEPLPVRLEPDESVRSNYFLIGLDDEDAPAQPLPTPFPPLANMEEAERPARRAKAAPAASRQQRTPRRATSSPAAPAATPTASAKLRSTPRAEAPRHPAASSIEASATRRRKTSRTETPPVIAASVGAKTPSAHKPRTRTRAERAAIPLVSTTAKPAAKSSKPATTGRRSQQPTAGSPPALAPTPAATRTRAPRPAPAAAPIAIQPALMESPSPRIPARTLSATPRHTRRAS